MVLKYSFPGFILAPWSSVRKENERRSKNLSYVCSVCMTFVFLTVIKIDAPCSVLPYPIACRPLASLGVKEFVLKYESVENIFFFCPVCVTVRGSPECLVPYVQSRRAEFQRTGPL